MIGSVGVVSTPRRNIWYTSVWPCGVSYTAVTMLLWCSAHSLHYAIMVFSTQPSLCYYGVPHTAVTMLLSSIVFLQFVVVASDEALPVSCVYSIECRVAVFMSMC